MSNYPSNLLTTALAATGDKTVPPATAADAGTGRFSQAEGFTSVNSEALADGGVPPYREDFNGAFYLLSQFALWYQQGGLMNWDASLTYEVGNEVLASGVKYRCIQQCTNVTPPNSSYWRNLDRSSVRPGAVQAFANVSVDSNGNPIFWGETEADTNWLLCDGRSDGQGGTVPDLVGRMIRGSTPANAGQTGGADSVTLTTAQMPSHTHSITLASAGAHTHTRGTMNITGYFRADRIGADSLDTIGGAFSATSTEQTIVISGQGVTDGKDAYYNFDASRSWDGNTSSDGSHTHSVSVGSTGSGSAVTVTNPYYTLAYFVKLPE